MNYECLFFLNITFFFVRNYNPCSFYNCSSNYYSWPDQCPWNFNELLPGLATRSWRSDRACAWGYPARGWVRLRGRGTLDGRECWKQHGCNQVVTGLVVSNQSNDLKLIKVDFINRGIHEKGSGDVVSAVCYTIYSIYLSLCIQTAETTSFS